jgi:protein transport protein SEC23
LHTPSCRFGQYTKDEASTFNLLPEMMFYPGFMFHLRRSTFVQVFGNSPDETAFARLMLFKEHTQHAIMMLQPQLLRYALGEPPAPAMVDVSSIVPEHILFLDTYFYIVVYHGNTIARWRAEGCARGRSAPLASLLHNCCAAQSSSQPGTKNVAVALPA